MTSVALFGKLAVSGSFVCIYMYSAELFPTQVRNIGAGVATIGARLGGFFAPIVLLLVSNSFYYYWLSGLIELCIPLNLITLDTRILFNIRNAKILLLQ